MDAQTKNLRNISLDSTQAHYAALHLAAARQSEPDKTVTNWAEGLALFAQGALPHFSSRFRHLKAPNQIPLPTDEVQHRSLSPLLDEDRRQQYPLFFRTR